ncbi:MAG: UDP-glucose/GDP-mannose dehydrogenase family protein [Enhydrobacter sp.]|nr:UDP-glucose/GDP-mannose dehydrogenase family protein [Enhydrobacter sp.]
MRITMIGSGYVGLVSGACFAHFGHDVICVDKDSAKIDRLRKGEMPIYEPGLDTLVAENSKAGRLTFTTNLTDAVADADAVFIAVGTPTRRGDGYADLTYVFAAAAEIARAIRSYTVVVTKSTVPVGTGREVARIIAETQPTAEFDVASNPEFLREGAAIEDFMRPDRVVIGVESERARAWALTRCRQPLRPECPTGSGSRQGCRPGAARARGTPWQWPSVRRTPWRRCEPRANRSRRRRCQLLLGRLLRQGGALLLS